MQTKKQKLVGFRQGPVPNTGHKGARLCDYFRMPRTYQERRYASAPELARYTRGKRRDHRLWFAFDDKERCLQRCWKKQGKWRYQWMHRLKANHKTEI